MQDIKYSPEALEDMKKIKSWIQSDWGDEKASHILKKLIAQINRLKQFPLSGVNLAGIIDVPTNYQYLYVEKNYIFYHINDEEIFIIRILNERLDFLHHLFGSGSKSAHEENADHN